jgi:peptidyl-tRNA hydrolase, PTH1 family
MKKIVVGLGNPGARYEKTRHNIGWMVLDRIADRVGGVGQAKARDGAITARARLDDDELVLVKPTTYMNLSGQAVRKVLARERAPLPDLLVVVDDMALPFGRLRLKARGSAGGHNGLRSIIGEMETDAFARLRLGIGAAPRGAVEHVLGDFASAEQEGLDRFLDAAADAVESWAREGAEASAARWNSWRPEPAAVVVSPRETPATGAPPSLEMPAMPSGDALQPADDAPLPDSDGVLKTRSGWRKLLPDALGKYDKDRGS